MSEAVVSTQSAVEQLRKADQRWNEAIRAFDDYPTRLRNLAQAADLRSRALTLAHLANITGKPRPGAGGLRGLAFELKDFRPHHEQEDVAGGVRQPFAKLVGLDFGQGIGFNGHVSILAQGQSLRKTGVP